MKQVLMGIVLFAVGVVFNPPRILQKAFSQLSLNTVAIAKANEPKEGEEALLTGEVPQFHIQINVPATELRLYEGDELLRRIPIAVGQARYPSPTSKQDKLTRIVWNPWWIPPKSDWAKDAKATPPGRGNPLGVVKMPLSNAVLIHGTNKPWSIGSPASHACIRMHNEDARNLAWTLQSSLTPYLDKGLLDEYAAKQWKTVNINLPQPIPVEFVYDTVEIEGDQIMLHRDLYGKVHNKKEVLLQKLADKGIYEEEINNKRFQEILKEWKRGRNQLTLNLKELKSS